MDVKLNNATYDIELDFNNGDFVFVEDVLGNQIAISLLTNAYDDEYELGLKQGGFINEEIGNTIWLLTLQNNFSASVRAEIKEQIRDSLIDYGDVEFSVVNPKNMDVNLRLKNNQQIIRSYKLV